MKSFYGDEDEDEDDERQPSRSHHQGAAMTEHTDREMLELAEKVEYAWVRCMCLLTGCRAGPGCPHYCSHCKQHIAAVARAAAELGAKT